MEYLTITLSLLAVCLAIYYYYLKNLNVFARHRIPHTTPLPLLGNLRSLSMQFSVMEAMQQEYNSHPDAKYVGFFLFLSPKIIVRDQELIKSIGVKNFDHFQDHTIYVDKKTDPLLSGILGVLKGDEWKHHRTVMSPFFTSSKIKNMYKLMSDCAVRFADYMSALPEDEREVDLKTMLAKYTNDVIASCAFGVEVDSIKHPNNELLVNARQASNSITIVQLVKQLIYINLPFLSRLLRISLVSKEVARFFRELLKEMMTTRKKNSIYRPDMLQLMMNTQKKDEPGEGLTDNHILSHAFGFYFGGFDSVSTQTSFIFHLLAKHPEVQDKLRTEIDEALRSNGGQFTYETVTGMAYLDAVVNEALRLHPIVLFLDRCCVKQFELPPAVAGGKPFVVQPGMNLWLPVWAVHKDPRYYEKPDTFDPERFLKDGKRIASSGLFLPFGIGPRMCIASRFAVMEMKVLICHILSRCEVKRGPKFHMPMELIAGSFFITSKHGFWLKIEPRSSLAN